MIDKDEVPKGLAPFEGGVSGGSWIADDTEAEWAQNQLPRCLFTSRRRRTSSTT